MTISTLSSEQHRSRLIDLFEGLGYELDPIEIDLDEWTRAGFHLPIDRTASLTHAGSFDEVELLLLRSPDPGAPRTVLETYRAFNRILRPLVAVKRNDLVELWGWAANGSIGRIDVPDDPTPEVLRRLELIASRPGHDLGSRIEVALSRETISRRFFRGFSRAVESITDELKSISIDGEEARSWAVLFLSRILFLFFIQEKRWLDGDLDFIRERSTANLRDPIFTSFFQPLFFDCLNTRPSQRDTTARRLGRIPYLNGGLFRRSPFEEQHPELTLSNELVRSIVSNLFAQFPFTIREDDETVVAIDPEMLGHVFESLMEEDERGRSGSYYTPKPIVDHLVRRAIRTQLGATPGEDDLSNLTESERIEMLARLRAITVLDPACGSGAFLLAAMKEIERLRTAVGDETPPGTLRQEIVETALFGVDLKREAVQLCELRLWLSIVAARPSGSETIESIQPLPNLDRNILQGNSLLDPLAFQAGQRASIHRSWRRSLRERRHLIESYRHAVGDRRQMLYRRLRRSDLALGEALLQEAIRLERAEIEELESQNRLFDVPRSHLQASIVSRIANLEKELERLKSGELTYFSYDLNFSSVMERGGFDLVVGNPPWVRGARLTPHLRETLRDRYEWLRPVAGESRSVPQFELSILFLEKATEIASMSGVVSMLLPAKILEAFYAERCRFELTAKHSVVAIDDWSRERDLFQADTFPIGITFTPTHSETGVEIVRDGERWTTDPGLLQIAEGVTEWSLLPPELIRLLRSIWTRHRSLSEVLGRSPVMGIKTGANRIFFLEESEMGPAGLTTPDHVVIPWKALTRCVRGRDVRRWRATDSTWMLWPEEPGDPEWKRQLAAARGVGSSDLRLAYVRPEHLGWKVVWKDVATRLEAVVVPDSVEILGRRVPLVPNQTLYCLDSHSLDETYLISAILNSSLVSNLACAIAESAKDKHFRFFGRTIGRLPWPEISSNDCVARSLIRLARAAHKGADSQREIDHLVCEIYGVDSNVVSALARWC